MAGRPAGPKVRKVKHARFHLGVQLNGKVFMSLDSNVHEKHGIEMWALPNNRLQVILDNEEWLIPDSVTHSMKLFPEEDSKE